VKADPSIRQVHIRVPSELKKALKMFCAREGTTEQAWLLQVINSELAKRASDIWSHNNPNSAKERSGAGHDASSHASSRRIQGERKAK
jgi:hypothetical protein